MAFTSLPRPLAITLLVFGILIGYQILVRVIRKLVHFPAPAFIGFFLDSDLRRWLQPPAGVIQGAGIQPGTHVLEIGCGSGAFTIHAARAVGPNGKIEALDIQPGMLAQLERKLLLPENSAVDNITLHHASAYQLPFRDGELDLVYLVTVLQEIPDRGRALAEIKRVLKPGGTLAISELLLDPDYVLAKTTVRQVRAEGFEPQGVFGNLWTYTTRFSKPAV